jgi:hypothetical protein
MDEDGKSHSVGNQAASGRPMVLRTGLAVGVPFREWSVISMVK